MAKIKVERLKKSTIIHLMSCNLKWMPSFDILKKIVVLRLIPNIRKYNRIC
jgi:hypothetical protein